MALNNALHVLNSLTCVSPSNSFLRPEPGKINGTDPSTNETLASQVCSVGEASRFFSFCGKC